MLCLMSDENVNGHIVAGLRRRQCPDLDLVRAQDVGLMNTPDPDILECPDIRSRKISSRVTVATPIFSTSRPPAMLASWIACS